MDGVVGELLRVRKGQDGPAAGDRGGLLRALGVLDNAIGAGIIGQLLRVLRGVDDQDPLSAPGALERPRLDERLDGPPVALEPFDRVGLSGPHGGPKAKLPFRDCCFRAVPLPFTAPLIFVRP